MVVKHAAFDGAFDVAAEQEAVTAIADAQRQRTVVFGRIGGDVIGRRGEDFDFGAAKREAARRNEGENLHSISRRAAAEQIPGRALRSGADPKLLEMKIVNQ